MEHDTTTAVIEPTAAPAQAGATADATAMIEEELLVEEISIDGMCGVY